MKLSCLLALLFFSIKVQSQSIISASPTNTSIDTSFVVTIQTDSAVSNPYNFSLIGKTTLNAYSAQTLSSNTYRVRFKMLCNLSPGKYFLSIDGRQYATPIIVSRNFFQSFEYSSVSALDMNIGGFNINGQPNIEERKFEGIKRIAIDSKGNVYYTGTFAGTANFGSGPVTASGQRDGFLAKYNSSGNLIWVKTLGSITNISSYEGLGSIKIFNDTIIYVCGALLTDINLKYNKTSSLATPGQSAGSLDGVLIKLDSSGTLLWHAFQGAKKDDMTHDLALDIKGNIYITGYIRGDVDQSQYQNMNCSTYVYSTGLTDTIALGAYSNDIYGFFTAKYSSTGKLIWANRETKEYTSTGGAGYNISVSSENRINILATSQFPIKYNGVACNNSGFGNNRYYLTQIDSMGNRLWCNSGGNFGTVNNLGHDLNENLYFVYRYSTEVHVVKYNSSGSIIWDRILSTNIQETTPHVSITDSLGNTYVGYCQNNDASGLRIVVLKKIDPSGVDLALTYPDPSAPAVQNYPTTLAFGKTQSTVFFAGVFSSANTFGKTLLNTTSPKPFIAKLSLSKTSLHIDDVNDVCKPANSKIVYTNPSFPDTLSLQISNDSFTTTIPLNIRIVDKVGSDTFVNIIPTSIPSGRYQARIISNTLNDTSFSALFNIYSPPVSGYTSSDISTCLRGNHFTFTDTSHFNTLFFKREWSINGIKTDTSAIFERHFTDAGDYLIKLAIKGGLGCSDSMTQNINVFQEPEATLSANGNTVFCEGDSVLLTTNDSSIYTQTWLKNDLPILFNKYNHWSTTGGEYKAIIKDEKGCIDTSSSLVIIVNERPSKPIIELIGKDSLHSSVNAKAYSWYLNDTLISNTNVPFLTVTEEGDYTLVLTSDSGCVGYKSDPYSFMPITTGLNKLIGTNNTVVLYPNPANNHLIAEVSDYTPFSFSLFDIQGKVLLRLDDCLGSTVVKLSPEIHSGLYFIEIKTQKGETFYEKLLIKR